MPLSEYQSIEILRMEARGISQADIAKHINCHQSSVSRVISKYHNHRTVQRLAGSGRKKITSERTDRMIKLSVDRNKGTNSKRIKFDLSVADIEVSRETIRRRLRSQGYRARTRRIVPMISKNNKKKRFQYAKDNIDQPQSHWKNMMFVDEKKFDLIMKPRRGYVWRKDNTALDNGNTDQNMRSQSIMVWGSFGHKGVGKLVFIDSTMTAIRYRDLLKKHLRASARKIGLKKGWILLQDNDPKHKSKIVQSELQSMGIKSIKHPPQSPDMNPIENLWDLVERAIPVSKRSNLVTFENAILEAWNNISVEICNTYAISMSNRISELYRARGSNTSY